MGRDLSTTGEEIGLPATGARARPDESEDTAWACRFRHRNGVEKELVSSDARRLKSRPEDQPET